MRDLIKLIKSFFILNTIIKSLDICSNKLTEKELTKLSNYSIDWDKELEWRLIEKALLELSKEILKKGVSPDYVDWYKDALRFRTTLLNSTNFKIKNK